MTRSEEKKWSKEPRLMSKRVKRDTKAVMLVITENIEMELFSEETCMVIQTQEKDVTYPSEQVSAKLKDPSEHC